MRNMRRNPFWSTCCAMLGARDLFCVVFHVDQNGFWRLEFVGNLLPVTHLSNSLKNDFVVNCQTIPDQKDIVLFILNGDLPLMYNTV